MKPEVYDKCIVCGSEGPRLNPICSHCFHNMGHRTGIKDVITPMAKRITSLEALVGILEKNINQKEKGIL